MITPASSSPRASTPVPRVAIRLLVWSSSPVSSAAAANTAPSTPISASDSSVPSTAVEVRADSPWVRYSTANMIRQDADHGHRQRIVPGQDRRQHEHQQHQEAQARARPARPAPASAPAAAPRPRRPRPARAAAARAGSRRSGTSPDPSGRRRTSRAPPGRPPRTAASPARPARSAPGPGRLAARQPSAPRRRRIRRRPSSPAVHAAARVATTSARTGCWVAAVGGGSPPVGHSSTTPTSVASAQGTSSAAMSSRTRRPAGAPARGRGRGRWMPGLQGCRGPAGRRPARSWSGVPRPGAGERLGVPSPVAGADRRSVRSAARGRPGDRRGTTRWACGTGSPARLTAPAHPGKRRPRRRLTAAPRAMWPVFGPARAEYRL